ncbi:helix-turn-helix domain-containing protein [Streptomyces phytophilus]|uniref:helix-turn-helix domain-containing protein n=1 Tax=Streptomyces phytophilus TaxID=722715 RepID=UPI0015F0254F|nr:helix-turn-helix domain-containing protein [Streptomyces phytophilus]
MSDDSHVSQPRLGELLKEWRKHAQYRLGSASPLTQKVVAERAGIGWRTYQALEAGEPRSRLAPAKADALAGALDLDAAERDLLFMLAARVRPGPAHAAGPDAAVLADLRLVLDSAEPTPAVLLDAMGNVQMYNHAMSTWFPHVREPHANMVRWCLSHPEARTQIVDWDQYLRLWLALLRNYQAVYGSSEPGVQQILSIIDADPVLRAIWEEGRDIRQDLGGERSALRPPCYGGARVEVVTHVLHPTAAPHFRVGVITPIAPVPEVETNARRG